LTFCVVPFLLKSQTLLELLCLKHKVKCNTYEEKFEVPTSVAEKVKDDPIEEVTAVRNVNNNPARHKTQRNSISSKFTPAVFGPLIERYFEMTKEFKLLNSPLSTLNTVSTPAHAL